MPEQDNYIVKCVCYDCEYPHELSLSKVQVAFFECLNIFVCEKCSCRKPNSMAFPDFKIDTEILEFWFKNKEVWFWPQDDELFLAMQPIQIFKDFLASKDDFKRRCIVIGEVLAIKLYDEDFNNSDERKWCIEWLNGHRSYWEQSSMDYIKVGIAGKLAT